jgi:formylglycine-generating enzyme required for sulfatase activity
MWEWVSDCGSEYYGGGTRTIRAARTGSMRIVRGGSWVNDDENAPLRISSRSTAGYVRL